MMKFIAGKIMFNKLIWCFALLCFFCSITDARSEDIVTEGHDLMLLNQKLDGKISLDLRDMDVVDVYKFLALKGDYNTTISKNIAGRVTLYLKGVSIRDALDIISLANNLAYRIIGDNIVYIMTEEEYLSMFGKQFKDKRIIKIIHLKYIKPAYALETLKNLKSEIGKVVIDEDTGSVVLIDTKENVIRMTGVIEEMDLPMEVFIFDLKYAKADDVATKLKEKLDNKAVGSTQADTRSNRIIVRAFPDRLKEVREIIEALDVKTKAVLIDVRILKIVLNPEFDMGLNWDTLFHAAHNLSLVGAFPVSTAATTAGSLGTIGLGTSTDDFTATIKMVKGVEATKTLASPSLMVTNNEEAKIHIGDKLAYVTTTTIGTGDSQRVNEEIHYIDVGVKFNVTPTINDDGFVKMKIKPEISSQSGTLETTQGAEVPLVNTTVVETDVLVKDGHTIIIAGLRKDEETNTKKGIPGAMDVPFVGKLFSSTSEDKTKTEIVILLTPHVVGGDEDYSYTYNTMGADENNEEKITTEYKNYSD